MKPSLVVIGLGNPGKAYLHTRHNAGFLGIDVLSKEYGQSEWKDSGKFEAHIQEARVVTVPVLLVKPQTYMNLSGQTVRKLVDFYKLNPAQQVLILCDDIDIALGTSRFREKGSAGTHNGLKSIVEQIGEGFPRMRIGIGPKPEKVDLAAWVVSALSPEETTKLESVIQELPAFLRTFVLEKAGSAE